MKILFDLGHPAHVHLFKSLIKKMVREGHEVSITAREKDITLNLLNVYAFEYKKIGKNKNGLFQKALNLLLINIKLLNVSMKFDPDLIVSAGSPYAAHVGFLLNKKSISFVDTEHANLTALITYPFNYLICTPSCYKKNHGKKHLKYNGYHELAYLHPNNFTPNPQVLLNHGFSMSEKIIIVRFVSWGASHDIGDIGFTNRIQLIDKLKPYGKIVISAEFELPPEICEYKLDVPVEDLHDLMFYSSLYIGESATMASECSILGVPSILVSSSRRSYTDELETEYGLTYTFSTVQNSEQDAIEKAIKILNDSSSKEKYSLRKDKMIAEKMDVTSYFERVIKGLI